MAEPGGIAAPGGMAAPAGIAEPGGPELRFPATADEGLRHGVNALVRAVVERQGAVGWLTPLSREETDVWLLPLLERGDVLCCGYVDGGLAAMGVLAARTGVFARMVDLQKVMSDPRVRGRGLARAVVEALVLRARSDGRETVRLGVRGNNARAIALYEGLGFVERGRFPNAIEVGHERYDDVWMTLSLGYAEGVVLRGSGPGGPGS